MDIRTMAGWIRAGIALFSLAAVAACGGGTDVAGGGTGGTGVGPVTGFGSVIVNGVRFDDTTIPAELVLDDAGRRKADLKAGMMVAVTGTVGDGTGRADDIEILRQVDGPLDDNGVDLAAGLLRIMGQQIRVDESTVYDNGIGGLADIATLQGANVAHPEIEVHGSPDNNGVIHATFVNKRADDRLAGGEVQLRGAVAGTPAGTTFVIGSKTVNFGGITGGLPAGVIAGSFVEIKGSLAPDNVLVATSVALEDPTRGQPAGDRAELVGFIGAPVLTSGAGGSFVLLGPTGAQTVNWTVAATVFEGGTQASIRTGTRIEAEGIRMADGSLAAAKLEFRRASNVRLEGQATAVTVTLDNLTVFGKTVVLNELTQFHDDRDNLKTFGPGNIAAGDFLKVSAYLDNTTTPAAIVATRVTRIAPLAPSEHILQGPVDSFTDAAIGRYVTLGTLNVQTAEGLTAFQNATGGTISQAAFFQALADDQAAGRISVVRARGAAPDGVSMAPIEVKFEPAGED
ncbi:MAG: DUF5666 domain-containing protein [Thermodesulfobacteriota bacterium]